MEKQKSRNEIINKVKKIVLNNMKDVPVRIFLFGSWARGEEKWTSDIEATKGTVLVVEDGIHMTSEKV